jgi:hypothetical protein
MCKWWIYLRTSFLDSSTGNTWMAAFWWPSEKFTHWTLFFIFTQRIHWLSVPQPWIMVFVFFSSCCYSTLLLGLASVFFLRIQVSQFFMLLEQIKVPGSQVSSSLFIALLLGMCVTFQHFSYLPIVRT